MSRIRYTARKFNAKSLAIIAAANQIIAEYQAQGFDLTLRQLYYQFVARDLIENSQRSYKRLGSVVSNARLAGLINWQAIVDRTRVLRALPHWSSPASILRSAAHGYRRDLWEDQPHRIEVWIEKDALLGVFQTVCEELDVPFFSCRGYTSQSAIWRAGQRLQNHLFQDQKPVILHFGDHDPSGMDMTRDNRSRVSLFAEDYIEVRRLALNQDQITKYDPPPNPTKLTDSRARAYIAQFGDDSWELDAMQPVVLAALVRKEVLSLRDEELWEIALVQQEEEREELLAMADKWARDNR